jgi:hypothetical protein
VGNFRRNSSARGKLEFTSTLFPIIPVASYSPLQVGAPGKPPCRTAPPTLDLPVIHAFSFTNIYVMMMAIDVACQVTQTTTAYVGSFNQPTNTSIRFQRTGLHLELKDIRIRPYSPLPHYYTQYGRVKYPVSKTEVTASLLNQCQNRAYNGLQIIFKPSNLFLYTADYPFNAPLGIVKPSMASSLLVKLPSFRGSLLHPSAKVNNEYYFAVVHQPFWAKVTILPRIHDHTQTRHTR